MFRVWGSKLQISRIIQVSRFATHYLEPPFTPEQLRMQREVFRTMPTYNPKDRTIKTCDYARAFEGMRYYRTNEQIEKYVEYANKQGETVINEDEFMRYMSTCHDPKLHIQEFWATFDKDKDGFISSEEYDYIVETLAVHDPKVKLVNYKKFVEEADSNKDGRVSVAEFRQWLRKFTSN